MTDLLAPLFANLDAHLFTSHMNGKPVLWVAAMRMGEDGRFVVGPTEGPFRDLAQAERALGDKLKFTAAHRRDCRPVGSEAP